MGYSLSHTEETKDILKFFDLNIKNDSVDQIKLNNIENLELVSLLEADSVLFISEYYKKIFSEKCPFHMKNKLHLTENGINNDEFNRENIIVPDSFKLPGKNKIKILFMGRFALSKNYYSIINSNLPDNIDIIIVGKKYV
jgi:hypothetical protein